MNTDLSGLYSEWKVHEKGFFSNEISDDSTLMHEKEENKQKTY